MTKQLKQTFKLVGLFIIATILLVMGIKIGGIKGVIGVVASVIFYIIFGGLSLLHYMFPNSDGKLINF